MNWTTKTMDVEFDSSIKHRTTVFVLHIEAVSWVLKEVLNTSPL